MAGSGGQAAAEGYNGPEEDAGDLLRQRLGCGPQVYMLRIFPPSSKTEGEPVAVYASSCEVVKIKPYQIDFTSLMYVYLHSSMVACRALYEEFTTRCCVVASYVHCRVVHMKMCYVDRVLGNTSIVAVECRVTCTLPVPYMVWGLPRTMLSIMS